MDVHSSLSQVNINLSVASALHSATSMWQTSHLCEQLR